MPTKKAAGPDGPASLGELAGDPTPAERANHIALLGPLLNAHERALFEGLQARMDTPNGRGWLRLIEHLKQAALDPVVVASRGAGSFSALMLMLAQDAVTAENAEQALLPIDGMLPKGEQWARLEALRSAAAKASNEVRARLPTREDLLREIARHRAATGCDEIEAKRKMADRYGVRLPAVNKRLRAPKPR